MNLKEMWWEHVDWINPLAPVFFLILAHSVYKMWITQEPKKVALWNKRHFEERERERERRRVCSMFKIFCTYICWIIYKMQHLEVSGAVRLTECPRRNVPDFGRVFLRSNYTDITQNTYVQIWMVTEILVREVWNFDSCYTLIDYQIHIKTGRNMWFL